VGEKGEKPFAFVEETRKESGKISNKARVVEDSSCGRTEAYQCDREGELKNLEGKEPTPREKDEK